MHYIGQQSSSFLHFRSTHRFFQTLFQNPSSSIFHPFFPSARSLVLLIPCGKAKRKRGRRSRRATSCRRALDAREETCAAHTRVPLFLPHLPPPCSAFSISCFFLAWRGTIDFRRRIFPPPPPPLLSTRRHSSTPSTFLPPLSSPPSSSLILARQREQNRGIIIATFSLHACFPAYPFHDSSGLVVEESGISGSRVVNSEICEDRAAYVGRNSVNRVEWD